MNSRAYRLTVLSMLLAVISVVPSGELRAQVRAKYSQGAAGLVQLLLGLPSTASALHTGAHPDDEDSALMARLARGDQARIAYLSLTRGEGGQNVIGPELFEGLGIIRSEELLQARRLDGGEQLFTRALDFGFSKTREEAAKKWGEEVILGDMVRAIRMYRPLVLISRFTGTPSDGHGHHRFVGYLTPIAFHQAGDPNQFPEQIAEGLLPWQPLKLYVSQGFRPDAGEPAGLSVATGGYDPLFGRSYFEIAIEGRSQHKSQEMGMLELRGPHTSGLRLLEPHVSTPTPESDLFDGIDTSLTGLAKLSGLPTGLIDDALSRAQTAARDALDGYDILEPTLIIDPLTRGLKSVREARQILSGASSVDKKAVYDADYVLRLKEESFTKAIQMAAGVVVDALADSETLVREESTRVEVRLFHPESSASSITVKEVRVQVPNGWRVSEAEPRRTTSMRGMRFRAEEGQYEAFFEVTAPTDAELTQPYWMDSRRKGDIYDWSDDDPKALAFGRPVAQALVSMEIEGVPIEIVKTVEYRYADPARGEIRRDVNLVPALTVSLDSNLLIVPTSMAPRTERMVVRVENQSREAMSGEVELDLPSGWKSVPVRAPFDLERKGEGTALNFQIEIPGGIHKGVYMIGVEAASGERRFGDEMHTISYPHVQTHRFYQPATATVQVLDLEIEDVRVGYLMGSGDRVPAAIMRMGLDVTLLDAEYLATGDLSRFDTIVVGIRASQVRSDFVANHGRIMDFVRQGGTLIVQYQRRDYTERSLPPYPAGMSQPEYFSNHRITDETAAIEVLRPDHPVFNFPNRIDARDWDGWVQERSLYHLTDLDPRYVPLLEAADPGETPHNGGLVYAKVGEGVYVYAGVSFFRQLPAGVPGAYRLFANLLSLSKAP